MSERWWTTAILTVHLSHGLHEIVCISEADKAKSFRLLAELVADDFSLEKSWILGESFSQSVVIDIITKVSTEYSIVIWKRFILFSISHTLSLQSTHLDPTRPVLYLPTPDPLPVSILMGPSYSSSCWLSSAWGDPRWEQLPQLEYKRDSDKVGDQFGLTSFFKSISLCFRIKRWLALFLAGTMATTRACRESTGISGRLIWDRSGKKRYRVCVFAANLFGKQWRWFW